MDAEQYREDDKLVSYAFYARTDVEALSIAATYFAEAPRMPDFHSISYEWDSSEKIAVIRFVLYADSQDDDEAEDSESMLESNPFDRFIDRHPRVLAVLAIVTAFVGILLLILKSS